MMMIILVVTLARLPGMAPIEVGYFETEKACLLAAAALDKSTPLKIRTACWVRT